MTSSAVIRPYRPEDRAALEDICIRTAHNGLDSRPVYADPGILPVIFATPYAELEPDLTFVLDDGRGQAVGYILGTADTPASPTTSARSGSPWSPTAIRKPAARPPPPTR